MTQTPDFPTKTWPLRLACEADAPALEELIRLSVRALQAPYYSTAQMEAALVSVFAVDRQLIRDGSYFVAERDAVIVGCGGWSRRGLFHGGNSGGKDPAKMWDAHRG